MSSAGCTRGTLPGGASADGGRIGRSGGRAHPSPTLLDVATLFTRIIDGELPGRFVWRDEQAVAFLTINPLTTGHTLVVPRLEVDHWLDLDPALTAHLTAVAQHIGTAQVVAFDATRVGLIIAGLEVPHTHLHVLPIRSEGDLNFAHADPSPDPADLDLAAAALREALAAAGHAEASA
jgi:histidine triad (HIT) family protein